MKYDRERVDMALDNFWAVFGDLKAYKKKPKLAKKAQIEAKFDKIFAANTGYPELDKALKAVLR